MRHSLIRIARTIAVASVLCSCVAFAQSSAAETSTSTGVARPPAVPLITHNPFLSIWSPADKLTDKEAQHWTGVSHPLLGLIRVDGQTFRVIGSKPENVPALPQTKLQITMTRSIYEFANDVIRLRLTFMSPLLPNDTDVLARPASYIIWDVASADGKPHDVSIGFGAGGELAVNMPEESVEWRREQIPGINAMRIGTSEQHVLASKGDDHRINWGYCYLASSGKNATSGAGSREEVSQLFTESGTLPKSKATSGPQVVRETSPTLFIAENLGKVTDEVTRYQVLAYDELYSIKYFGTDLLPYWRRNGMDASALLKQAINDFKLLRKKCETFDNEVATDAAAAGGDKYAWLCALTYRQTIAGCGLAADAKGAPLLFPKECFSNGCISTVDVLFPMCPQLLLFSPVLTKAVAVPILDYASSPAWAYPYAPHDLGTYPMANGQIYGMGGSDADRMPVEESGNMLILLAALAHAEGNANFPKPYMPMLAKWADYLADQGFDPANQLCTDDFAGHLARNANLAVKAVLGVRAMAELCSMTGDSAGAAKYEALAKQGVAKWMELGWVGDHSVLAFGKPDTWSLKYNLVWDRALGYNIFPPEVAGKEVAFYKKQIKPYGLPLDSRENPDRPGMCKVDWTVWAGSLDGTRETLETFAGPLYEFYNFTPDRHPMTDWFSSVTGRMVRYGSAGDRPVGFMARPVVGAVFFPLLNDKNTWAKWVAKSGGNPKDHIWAPRPDTADMKLVPAVAAANTSPGEWKYTTSQPPTEWTKPGFDDASWKTGKSGFGTTDTPGAIVNTEWNTPDIWLRRTVTIPADAKPPLVLFAHHDETAEIFINGIPAARLVSFTSGYEPVLSITKQAQAQLKPGAKVTIAVHCHQTVGGQYIDVGIGSLEKQTTRKR